MLAIEPLVLRDMAAFEKPQTARACSNTPAPSAGRAHTRRQPRGARRRRCVAAPAFRRSISPARTVGSCCQHKEADQQMQRGAIHTKNLHGQVTLKLGMCMMNIVCSRGATCDRPHYTGAAFAAAIRTHDTSSTDAKTGPHEGRMLDQLQGLSDICIRA